MGSIHLEQDENVYNTFFELWEKTNSLKEAVSDCLVNRKKAEDHMDDYNDVVLSQILQNVDEVVGVLQDVCLGDVSGIKKIFSVTLDSKWFYENVCSDTWQVLVEKFPGIEKQYPYTVGGCYGVKHDSRNDSGDDYDIIHQKMNEFNVLNEEDTQLLDNTMETLHWRMYRFLDTSEQTNLCTVLELKQYYPGVRPDNLINTLGTTTEYNLFSLLGLIHRCRSNIDELERFQGEQRLMSVFVQFIDAVVDAGERYSDVRKLYFCYDRLCMLE
jgi:hypothetical protein